MVTRGRKFPNSKRAGRNASEPICSLVNEVETLTLCNIPKVLSPLLGVLVAFKEEDPWIKLDLVQVRVGQRRAVVFELKKLVCVTAPCVEEAQAPRNSKAVPVSINGYPGHSFPPTSDCFLPTFLGLSMSEDSFDAI